MDKFRMALKSFKENLQIDFWNFRINLQKIDLVAPRIGALIILLLGIGLIKVGFYAQYPDKSISFVTLLPDFYANASTTLIGIALTVLFIDALNRRRDERLEKIRLIRDMGCGDNGIALRAVIEITENNLHWKGFLRDRHFWCARLTGAQLISADLSYSTFHHAELSGASLFGAKLFRTSFWHANLRGVDFRNADLTNADFIYADLTDAFVTKKQLLSADRLLGVRLPNGSIYNGYLNLPGDLLVAQELKIDLENPIALATFYAMPYEQFENSSDLRVERPEFTDWE